MWDELKKLFNSAGDGVKKEATKQAAKQSLNAAKAALSLAGDDFLDAAEKELSEAQEARGERQDVRPENAGAQSAADRVMAAVRAAESDEEPQGLTEVQKSEARAKEELERLKAQLRAKSDAGESQES